MADLSSFPITHRWPAANPEVIQLYSFPTPNGVKASIMLEETGLSYEAHRVALSEDGVGTKEFLSLNPNHKIPAIIDPNGPEGAPLALFESGAILIYLADKTGQLLPRSGAARYQVLQWLMFQMGGVGPMFGQMGHFWKGPGADTVQPYPRKRYLDESRRLLGVMDGALEGQDWIAGDYSIADIALVPWVGAIDFYGTGDELGLADFTRVLAWRDRFLDRPAVQRGRTVPAE